MQSQTEIGISRLFREEFNVSLRSRQTELRLRLACELLANSPAKISVVARESGYRHLGLFNAMFKKKFGMTPSDWRQKAAAPTINLSFTGAFFILIKFQYSDIFQMIG